MSESGDEATTVDDGYEVADSEPSEPTESHTESEPVEPVSEAGISASGASENHEAMDSEPMSNISDDPGSEHVSSPGSVQSLHASGPTSERMSVDMSYTESPQPAMDDKAFDSLLLRETSSQIKKFTAEIVDEVLAQVVGKDSYEYDEMPGEDDVRVEDLEAPLGDWVTSLLPTQEQLEPSSTEEEEFIEESEPCIDASSPPQPCLPGELLPDVIMSDSPMMKRFQAALRKHLLKQIKRLDEDIINMDGDIKKTKKECSDLGDEIYREQLAIKAQSQKIDKYKAGIDEVTKKMRQYDKAINSQKKEHESVQDLFNNSTKEERASKIQVEEFQDLLIRLNELKQTQLDELKSSQNLSDKQKMDKMKKAAEKQKQDMLLWKLNKEKNKITIENERVIQRAELKRHEVRDLKKTVSDLQADYSGLVHENQLIRSATEKLFFELHNRNIVLTNANRMTKDVSSQIEQVAMHMRSYNKSLRYEAQRQVKIIQSSNVSENIIEDLLAENKKLIEKKESLIEQLAHLQDLMDREELTYAEVDKESKELFKQQSTLIKEVDRLVIQRSELEKKYTTRISELKLQSSALKSLTYVIRNISHENQDLGLMKLENDCKIGQLMTEIEKTKVERIQAEVRIDNLRNAIRERENDFKVLLVAKKKLKTMILELKSKTLGAKKLLEQLLKNLDESSSENRHVLKINDLKGDIEDLDSRIEELRNSWTEVQNMILKVNKQLSDVEVLVSITRKQVHVLKHKRHKLEEKEKELMGAEKTVLREKRMLERMLGRYSLEAIQVEEDCDRLVDITRENQQKYMYQLKDAETETVNLQDEITELTEGNADREDEVTDLQRELLGWEKKWTIAVEAKEKLDHELSSQGEIGAMRREIHRMQVRLSQLRKVQERLSIDLELSVNQRDCIMDSSFARERRGKPEDSGSKRQFEKKLQDLRSKIRQFKAAILAAKEEVDKLELKREELMEDFINKRSQLSDAKAAVDRLESDIQEGHLHKYKNLELVVRKQRKMKMLDDVKTSKYRLLHKTESSLLGEDEKQKRNNAAMLEVVDSLMSDFPQLRLPLLQIQNTLTMVVD